METISAFFLHAGIINPWNLEKKKKSQWPFNELMVSEIIQSRKFFLKLQATPQTVPHNIFSDRQLPLTTQLEIPMRGKTRGKGEMEDNR